MPNASLMHTQFDPAGENEKRGVASNSVIAAIFLTGLKIVVGVLSGSIGILAEAAHSALDFVAALITYFAVRACSKPADRDHAYGHGKVENLSALTETLLLLVSCGWILYESIHRLISPQIEIDISIWAFAVMFISIIVDISRSHMLYKAAQKYHSQALEADALHFGTDIWSSAVVIIGLIFVQLAHTFPSLGFLYRADAIAALFVAVIVVGVSLRLGVRTLHALMDATPVGLTEKVHEAVHRIEGVLGCHGIRIRQSGPHYFADLHIALAENLSLRETYAIIEKAEAAVREVIPGIDVTVRPEPRG